MKKALRFYLYAQIAMIIIGGIPAYFVYQNSDDKILRSSRLAAFEAAYVVLIFTIIIMLIMVIKKPFRLP